MSSRLASLFASITLFAVAAPALAEDVIIYERSDFRGRSVNVTQQASDLELLGFERRAASLFVMSGTWEFCTEPNYRGNCRIFGPGEYRDLGDRANRVASGRLITVPAQGRDPGDRWNNSGGARAELFDRENFAGPLATLNRVTPNFEPLGYNDAVASIVIRRGTWEFCSDANFRGECRIYGPGEYPRLGRGQDDRYSSARPVQNAGVGPGPGNNRPQPPSSGRTRIQLFEYANFGGRSITLNGPATNFDPLGFNDKAESVIVHSGVWTLCSDANRGGQCRELRSGQYPTLPRDINSRVSSAYPR